MFKKTLAIAAAGILLSACGAGGVNDFKAAQGDAAPEMFAAGCANCHGSDGSGKFGFMFKLEPAGKSVEELATTILTGREGMPAFPNLNEAQRKALAEHIIAIRK